MSKTDRRMVKSEEREKHFVLVHGFGHGAWCWYKLVGLLKSKGHTVTALDLGGCGVHPKQLHQISSVSDYLQPLMDFMAALPDDDKVILVGHSYGGIPISLAMENFPEKVSFAVFVTAYMPNCKHPPATLILESLKRGSTKPRMDTQFTFDQETGTVPISAVFGPEYLKSVVYRHCPIEELELAKMLIRPGLLFVEEMGKKSWLTEERYGQIRRCYVICGDDEVMEEEFQRYNIDNNPPQDEIYIAGAGHMVMLSKPQELCFCLLELAKKYY